MKFCKRIVPALLMTSIAFAEQKALETKSPKTGAPDASKKVKGLPKDATKKPLGNMATGQERISSGAEAVEVIPKPFVTATNEKKPKQTLSPKTEASSAPKKVEALPKYSTKKPLGNMATGQERTSSGAEAAKAESYATKANVKKIDSKTTTKKPETTQIEELESQILREKKKNKQLDKAKKWLRNWERMMAQKEKNENSLQDARALKRSIQMLNDTITNGISLMVLIFVILLCIL